MSSRAEFIITTIMEATVATLNLKDPFLKKNSNGGHIKDDPGFRNKLRKMIKPE